MLPTRLDTTGVVPHGSVLMVVCHAVLRHATLCRAVLSVLAELFASSFPTVVLYILDTPRCTSPQSFMSNMLQAVSILYKTKLPMILVRRS